MSASAKAWARLYLARAEYESTASTLRLLTRCGMHCGTAAGTAAVRRALALADRKLTRALEEVEALP